MSPAEFDKIVDVIREALPDWTIKTRITGLPEIIRNQWIFSGDDETIEISWRKRTLT